jgi:hypothetical protein
LAFGDTEKLANLARTTQKITGNTLVAVLLIFGHCPPSL